MVVPSLYLTTPEAAANLRRYVDGGGTLLVGCFSGIVDAWDRVYPGSHPGALRDVLGVTVEEWLPLRSGERAGLAWEAGLGWEVSDAVQAPAGPTAGPRRCDWREPRPSPGTPTARRPAAPPSPGTSSATGRRGTCPRALTPPPPPPCSPRPASRPDSRPAAAASGRRGGGGWPRDLEVVRRTDGHRRFITLINHGDSSADVTIGDRLVTVPAGDVTVIQAE